VRRRQGLGGELSCREPEKRKCPFGLLSFVDLQLVIPQIEDEFEGATGRMY
jgi:hypothetical protein